MNRLLPIFAVLLSLVVAVTSQQMMVMRGQNMAVGEMILCTGQGPVSVSVDENGQPTGPAHICPDCALSLLDFAPVSQHDPIFAAAQLSLTWVPHSVTSTRHAKPNTCARGPPVLV